MNMQEIRAIAKNHNINSVGLSKIEIIRTLQRKEGNFDCYASAYAGNCDQAGCLWRDDCMEASRQSNKH